MDETALQLYRRQRLELAVAQVTQGNVTAFGRLLGYRDGAFMRQMLSGTRAVSDKTVRAIEALRGMGGWFAQYPAAAGYASRPAAPDPGPEDEDGIVAVPIAALSLHAGKSGQATRHTDGAADGADTPQALFTQAWLRRRGYLSARLLALRVNDDSMRPSLHEADVVTVDTRQTEPMDGKVFAVNYEGACLVRRLVRDRGAWWLVADNPLRFPRKQLSAPGAMLIGRAVHLDSETI
ncbi:S24 family peptidase [Xylophilus sp. ASV27]|uniref:S24 family peptidase n=1 Tax=Xylophilus sp. ASV27 TaxID=2795129 RepID=UPI0018EAFA06|nr:S24 family peptidase [Xylophilus sp. ASV27]